MTLKSIFLVCRSGLGIVLVAGLSLVGLSSGHAGNPNCADAPRGQWRTGDEVLVTALAMGYKLRRQRNVQ